jgi:D-ribulokinase
MVPTMTEALWAGVDVGTQSLRVQVLDEAGAVMATGAAPLEGRRQAGRHEQDPEGWWQALGVACRQALSSADAAAGHGLAGRVRALATCSTSGTFLLADAEGAAPESAPGRRARAPRPRTPALMYDDSRARAQAQEVAEAGSAVWRRLGYRMQPSWALPKLVWLLREGPPDLRADARAGRVVLLHSADFLAWRLTGVRTATDWSHALKTGYDLDELAWPEAVLETLGVPPAMLPQVVRPGTPIGTVGAAGAEHTGLAFGTPVVAGLTDGCAAQVAANALAPGSWNAVLGTTLVLKGVTGQRLADPVGVVYSHRHPDGGWLPGGASNTGAGALERAFPAADRQRLEAEATRHEPSSGLAWPLVSRGERFPFVSPDAEPFELGEFDGDGDRYAAMLQGVAFVERLAFAVLGRLGADLSGPVSATGGGSRSAYWTQLRADILGRELVLPGHAESAVGAAIVAAAGKGPLAPAAARLAGPGRTVAPRPGRSDRLLEAYDRFLDTLLERGHIEAGLARFARARE